jgi:hypothetical protein
MPSLNIQSRPPYVYAVFWRRLVQERTGSSLVKDYSRSARTPAGEFCMEDDIHAGTAVILGIILTGSPVGRGQAVHSELRHVNGTAALHFRHGTAAKTSAYHTTWLWTSKQFVFRNQ